ncbi:hypothetical protein IWZ03DRAFT_81392 [Phyllosticta citriasiana]|uniref:Uncharacterized protein n=1 Tax=Phyllosticta citriasiana TaxID=595635 RepID=A0ABR1KF32_9PEZI
MPMLRNANQLETQRLRSCKSSRGQQRARKESREAREGKKKNRERPFCFVCVCVCVCVPPIASFRQAPSVEKARCICMDRGLRVDVVPEARQPFDAGSTCRREISRSPGTNAAFFPGKQITGIRSTIYASASKRGRIGRCINVGGGTSRRQGQVRAVLSDMSRTLSTCVGARRLFFGLDEKCCRGALPPDAQVCS